MNLLDIIIIINDWTTKNNNYFLSRIKFYSLCRFLNKHIGFFLIKVYFFFSKNNQAYKLDSCNSHCDIIVSLTSFPGRMNSLVFSLETMLRQRLKPKRILVYLSLQQFPKGLDSVPLLVRKLKDRGVEFVFVEEDYRSHKKYFYSFPEFSASPIVTIDDDLLYDSRIIERLYSAFEGNNQKVYCSYGYLMKYNSEKELLPYNEWRLLEKFCDKSPQIFFGSGGGTLFPPNFFDERLVNIDDIKECCFNADDIWLNAFCRLMNVEINYLDGYYIFDIPVKSKVTLSSINKGQNKNDIQINNVIKLFKEKYNFNLFIH